MLLTSAGPLIYPGLLPLGALVRVNKIAPAPAEQPAPLWLDATCGVTLSDAGRVLAWSGKGGGATACPVPGNVSGTGFLNDPPALHFVAGENGGLRLSDAIADAGTLTFGLIVTPDLPEARTLLSLQPLGHEDYIFLSMEGMRLRLARRDADSALAVTLPPDSRVPLLILCSLSGDEVVMSVNGGPPVGARLAAERGPADLFIGCRNGRKGMKNKLGGFDLSDVLVWPGQNLHATPEGLAAVNALWEDRCRRGV
jgi:hypothetical protein